MPTGYTADVQAGKVTTLTDFTLNCARAFGALVMLRDEPNAPIPTEVLPDTQHYDDKITRLEARLRELLNMTAVQRESAADDAQATAYAGWADRQRQRQIEQARYEAMLAQVEAWRPPTPEHEGLKTFMQDQLRESIQFDCFVSGSPNRLSADEWHSKQLQQTVESLSYARQHRAEEITRAAGRTQWIQALLRSLPGEVVLEVQWNA